MSDPVTNIEIEDVLSSIRRLVSENGRAPSGPASVAQEFPAENFSPPVAEPLASSPLSDKLVLTDALRVEEKPQDSDRAENVPQDTSEMKPRFQHHEFEKEELTEDLDSTGRIERNIDLSFESRRLTFTAIADEIQFNLPAVNPFVEIDTPDAHQKVVRPWEIEGETLSDWHTTKPDETDPYEPDTPGDSDYAGTAVAPLDWEDHTVVDQAPVSEKQPVAEAHVPDANAKTDEAQDEPIAEPPVVDAVEFSEQTDVLTEDQPYETVLDEEMLRELVGEIVRQELQGPLGERITRNVRKLVRREINRAMAARSLGGEY